ncbi:DUF4806 domain-containing protein, partial [Aphis craccivora]
MNVESSYCGETTNDEARGRGKRKKYKTQSFFSSSDDNLSDDQISIMKAMPNPPAWTKKNNMKSSRNLFGANYHKTGKALTNPEVESIHNTEDMFGSNGLSMLNAEENNDMSGMKHLTNTPTNTANLGTYYEYNYRLTLNNTHCHSPAVSNNVGITTNESDSTTGVQEKFRNVFNNFPLRCLSDVVEMEEKLKDSASYHLM